MLRKLFCTLMLFLLFCVASSLAAERPVAEIKKPGIVITQKDLNRYISYYGPEAEKSLSIPEKKAEFLWDVVKMFAVAAYAKDKGFDERPDIKDKIAFLRKKFIAREYLKERLEKALKDINLTEEDLRLYYKTHSEEFRRPDEIRFSAVILEATNKDSSLKDLAQIIRKQLLKDKSLQISTTERVNLSIITDSGWRSLNNFEGALKDFLKKSSPGRWSKPIETGNRVYLLKVLERKQGREEPFERVKGKIKKKLLQEARKNKLKEIISEILRQEGAEIYYQNFLH